MDDSRPAPRRRRPAWPAVTCALAMAIALPAFAQIPGLPGLTGDAKPAATGVVPARETAAKAQASAAEQLEAARSLRDRLAGGGTNDVPEGIGADEVATANQAIGQYIFAVEGQQRAAEERDDARKARADAEAEARRWTGFAEQPPYSMLLVDDLREAAAARRSRIAALQADARYAARAAERYQDQMKRADVALRQAREAAADAAPGRAPAANWRAEMAQWAVRAAAASAVMVERMIAATQAKIDADQELLKLTELKLGVATRDVRFAAEDLERVRQRERERLKRIEKERSASLQRAIEASHERNAAAAALAKLRADPAATPARLAGADARMRAADAALDAARFATDVLDAVATVSRTLPELWRLRFDALNAGDAGVRREAVVRLRGAADRVGAGRTYADSQLAIVRSALHEESVRLGTTDPAAGTAGYETAIIEALRQRSLSAQLLRDTTDQLAGSLQRWLDEIAAEQGARPWRDRVAGGWASAAAFARGVWNFELFDVEETIDADGQKVTVSRGVTVGKSVGALLLFVLGYLLGARITRRLERFVVRRFAIEPAPARTVRRWVLALWGFMLVVLTLNLARIPLTVFAFLGGALAIGVGFGTQTIIKNFISGLILLMERQVRVGDTVEVDGMTGTVTEVNVRSSTILGFDGVEAIIPNSSLLEQRVTNWTHTDRKLRRVVKVGVAYGSPVRDVATIMKECADRHGLVLKEPAPLVLFEDFGDNALLFALYFWIEMKPGISSLVVMSDLRFMLEKQFGESGIVVAYPQRDVHVDATRPLQVEIRRTPDLPAAGTG